MTMKVESFQATINALPVPDLSGRELQSLSGMVYPYGYMSSSGAPKGALRDPR
jgi:hypothetical protein